MSRVRTGLPWSSMLATVALAGVAAFVGVRLGTQQASAPPVSLSERIFELIGDERELTATQREAIRAVGERMGPAREDLRMRSRNLNVEVIRIMAEEKRFGPKSKAKLDELQVVMGDRLRLSLEYMVAIRAQLTPAQAARFEANLAREASESR